MSEFVASSDKQWIFFGKVSVVSSNWYEADKENRSLLHTTY
jgi:hypothetical protein